MKGHIRERSPGHWAIVIELRDPATGKRRRKWHKFAGTKRKAQDECARLISELNGGLYIEPAKITVGQFLDRWLEHVKPLVSPRTHERYGELVTKNLTPLLGAVLLTKLRPMQISDAYAKALSSGHRKGKGGLAPSTVRYMHVILKAAMRQAVRWQMLVRNPVDAVDPPKIERAAVFDIGRGRRLDGTRDLVGGEIRSRKRRHRDHVHFGGLTAKCHCESARDGRRGLQIDLHGLSDEPVLRNLQAISAVGQISKSNRPLGVRLKAALDSRSGTHQFSRSLHRRTGRVLHLDADLARRILGAQRESRKQKDRKKTSH